MEPDERYDEGTNQAPRSWSASVRLAMLFSAVAGFAALILAGHVSDLTIVVSVIVAGTAVSWLQLEDTPVPAPVRAHRRRHHR